MRTKHFIVDLSEQEREAFLDVVVKLIGSVLSACVD